MTKFSFNLEIGGRMLGEFEKFQRDMSKRKEIVFVENALNLPILRQFAVK